MTDPATGDYRPPPAKAAATEAPIAAGHPTGNAKPLGPERPPRIPGYEILGELGRGANGTVYKARHFALNRFVAVKLITGTASPSQHVRFRLEAEAVAKLQHPNIIQIYEVGAVEGQSFLALEFVDGGTLLQAFAGTPQPPRDAAGLVETLARAVHHAHERRIVHRDLKPSNVLVTAGGVPKVADFGLARFLDAGVGLTATADFAGTPAYTSPEQANGLREVGPAADVHALGIILYELLTGRLPFTGDGVPAVLRAIADDPPIPPRRLRPQVPRDLDTVVLKCLEKKPAARYATANDLADDLRRFQADEPIRARPIGALGRAARWANRNRAVAALLGAVGLLLTALGVGGTVAAGVFMGQRDDAVSARKTIADAQRDGEHKLWDSLVAQADANRLSRRPGQRFATLDRLRDAVVLARKLELPPADFQRMRNAAIAALALPDLILGPPWYDAADGGIDFADGLQLYARSDGGTVTVRRVSDDAVLHHLPGAKPHFRPDGSHLAVESGGRLHVWRLSDPPRRVIDDPNYYAVQFQARGPLLAALRSDRSLAVYDLTSGAPAFPPTAPEYLPPEPWLALHPKEAFAAVTSYWSPDVRVVDARTGTDVTKFQPAPQGRNYPPTWNPDGTVLVVPSGGEAGRLYEHGTWRLIREQPDMFTAGSRLRYNAAGDRWLVIGWSAHLSLVDGHTGRTLFSAPAGDHGVPFNDRNAVPFFAGERDAKVGVWRVGDAREFRTLAAASPNATRGYGGHWVSPDGRLVVATHGAGGFALWDAETGRALAFVERERLKAGVAVHFAPSGDLLTNGLDGVFRWPVRPDPSNPRRLTVGPPTWLSLPGSTSWFNASASGAVAVGHRAAYGVRPENAGGWVVHPDRPFLPLRLTREELGYAAISPDGRFVATFGYGANVRCCVWDARSGDLVKDLGAGIGTYGAYFTQDGAWLVSATKRWRLSDWAEEPYKGGVPSPDGRLIALSLPSGSIRLTRADTQAEVALLEAPKTEGLGGTTFSPDGSRLFVATASGIHVWDLRRLRASLADLGLDWDAPRYPPAKAVEPVDEVSVLGQERFADPRAMDTDVRTRLALAIAANPLDGGAYYQLGLREQAAKRYAWAFELLTIAVRLLPDYPAASLARAEVGLSLGRWNDASADAGRVLARQPSDPQALFVRGVASRHLGRPADAVTDLTASLQVWPGQIATLLERADAHVALGDANRAAADLARVAAVGDRLPAMGLNNVVWRMVTGPPASRDPRRALELIDKRLKAEPNAAIDLNTVGVVQYRNGLYREAIATLEKHLADAKGELEAYDLFFLAMSHAKLGESAEARDCFDRAVRSLDKKPKLTADQSAELTAFRAEAESELKSHRKE